LTGLVSYVGENVDGLELDTCMVIVHSYAKVSLVTRVHGEENDRHTVIEVTLDSVERFPFGTFMSIEEFNVRIRSQFVRTVNRDTLTQYVSRIDVEQAAQIHDDGVSQSTTVKRAVGGHLAELEEAPAVLALQPFRTFSEVAQPESEFLFRMRQNEAGVSVALFEADGGAWQNVARSAIMDYLQEQFDTYANGDLAIIA